MHITLELTSAQMERLCETLSNYEDDGESWDPMASWQSDEQQRFVCAVFKQLMAQGVSNEIITRYLDVG